MEVRTDSKNGAPVALCLAKNSSEFGVGKKPQGQDSPIVGETVIQGSDDSFTTAFPFADKGEQQNVD